MPQTQASEATRETANKVFQSVNARDGVMDVADIIDRDKQDLVEALRGLCNCITETRGPNAIEALHKAHDALNRHTPSQQEDSG